MLERIAHGSFPLLCVREGSGPPQSQRGPRKAVTGHSSAGTTLKVDAVLRNFAVSVATHEMDTVGETVSVAKQEQKGRRELNQTNARREYQTHNGAYWSNGYKTGDDVGKRAPERTNHRCVTSSALQPRGDKSRTHMRETTPKLPHGWAWSPL